MKTLTVEDLNVDLNGSYQLQDTSTHPEGVIKDQHWFITLFLVVNFN